MAGTLDNSKIIQVYLTDANGNPGSIPAPVGGALETTQAAGNVSLSSLDTKMTANNTKLDTLITALAAANASLDDIETAAENTAPTLTARAPYTVARPITPNTNVAAGQGVLIVCTVAGNQVLELSSGNTITVAVAVGTSFIDNLAVIDAPSSGTTATATVTVLAVS